MAKLRKEKVRRARCRRERGRWRAQEMSVVDLESLDGRKTGIGLHDGNDTATGGFGRRRRHYCDVQHRKKYGRGEGETDMWGPCVRFDFHLISNFWIVTILPPKRNLVPRFRRKVSN